MRRVLIGTVLGLVALVAACDPGSPSEDVGAPLPPADKTLLDNGGHPLLVPNSDPGVTVFESELLRLVNDYRLVLGLSPLIPSPRLGDAARAHSQHMIEHRFFSHSSPEGLTPGERLALASVVWSAVGENIASAYSTPQAVFEAWMASPKHRKNIESDLYTHAGVGYAQDPAPTAEFPDMHYWAMVFLKR